MTATCLKFKHINVKFERKKKKLIKKDRFPNRINPNRINERVLSSDGFFAAMVDGKSQIDA